MNPSHSNPTSWITDCVDDFTRQDPKASVCSAFGLGLFLHFLPLKAIVAWSAGVAFSLARPALLVLGILKACEFCGIHFNPTSKP